MSLHNSELLRSVGFSRLTMNRLVELNFDLTDIASHTELGLQSNASNELEVSKCNPILLTCSSLAASTQMDLPQMRGIPSNEHLIGVHVNEPVTFSSLIQECWRNGIPVLPLDKLKTAFSLPEYLIIWQGQRPMIYLSIGSDCSSRNLYKLAHAVCKSRLLNTGKQSYVCSELPFNWGGYDHLLKNKTTELDRLTHKSAIELLTRSSTIDVTKLSQITSPGRLALECDLMGESELITGGILALCVANQFLSWDLARDALEYLETVDCSDIIHQAFRSIPKNDSDAVERRKAFFVI
jgi:hypothetical protein